MRKTHESSGRIMRQILGLSLLFFVACGGSEVPPSLVRDSLGITIVQNEEAIWETDRQDILSSLPLIDLGAADAPDEYQFEYLVAAVHLPGQGFVIADRGRKQVLFYDARGNHLHSAGGPGEGPGEFRDIGALGRMGDSILAFDWRQGRLTVLDTSGNLVGTVDLGPTGDDRHPIHTYNLAGVLDGKLLLAPWAIMPLGQRSVGPYWDSASVLIYGLDGGLQGSLPEAYRTEMYVGTQGSSGRPFGARTSISSSGSKVFMGTGKRFEVRVFGSDGKLQRIVRRRFQPSPVTAEVIDSLLQYRLRSAGLTTPGDPRAAAFRNSLESAPIPEEMPAFSWVFSDSRGRIWVQIYSPAFRTGPREWSLFDESGTWLGSAKTPARFDILGVCEDLVMGVWRDSLNVQHFQVYAIDWPD